MQTYKVSNFVKKEAWLYTKENRWEILAHNHYFKQEVEKTRLQLGTLQIPEDMSLGRVFRFWVAEFHTLFPGLIEELLEGKTKPEQWSRQWISPEAPIESLLIFAHSLHFMRRFDLPERWQVLGPIAYYLISGDFDPQKYVGKRPEILIIDDSLKKQDDLIYLLNWNRGIAFKIDEYTTEKEFTSLWKDVVKVRDTLQDTTGIKPPHHRQTGEKSEKRLLKYLEWYELRQQADSVEKALDKLAYTEAGAPPIETFKYGVNRIDELMRPIP